jgi:hypothetical protein
MSITRDPPAHQLGRGLSSPSENTVMRCTPPLCTSLPCIDLPPSSVVGHALASTLLCPCCALHCSAAHALLHPRARICHTLVPALATPEPTCCFHCAALQLLFAQRSRASAVCSPEAVGFAPALGSRAPPALLLLRPRAAAARRTHPTRQRRASFASPLGLAYGPLGCTSCPPISPSRCSSPT